MALFHMINVQNRFSFGRAYSMFLFILIFKVA